MVRPEQSGGVDLVDLRLEEVGVEALVAVHQGLTPRGRMQSDVLCMDRFEKIIWLEFGNRHFSKFLKTRSGPKIPAVGLFGGGDILDLQ